jgi:hypothetical protein
VYAHTSQDAKPRADGRLTETTPFAAQRTKGDELYRLERSGVIRQ